MPKNEKSQSISLDLSMLTSKLDEVKAIDEKLAAAKGTAAEWLKKGTAAASETVLADYVGTDVFSVTFELDGDTTVGNHIDEVRAYLLDAEQFGNELATAWIKANRKDSDESSALRTRRETLANEAEALRVVFGQVLGADAVKDLEVPKAPRSSVSSGTPRTAKVGSMTFYRLVDGEKVRPSASQDSLSSMAWYQFGKVGVGVLRDAIAKAHGKVDETTPWEGAVTCNEKTWTIGWEKVEAMPDAPTDETKDDDTKEGDDETK